MNINKMIKQAQAMQKKIEKDKVKIESLEINGESGGGDVKVKITGKGKVIAININDNLIEKENKEILEDLILVAINNAKKLCEDKISEIVGPENEAVQGLKATFKL